MRNARRGTLLAVVISLGVTAGGLALAAPAQAQPAESGTFAFGGDEGDYISGGSSYSYDVAAGDRINVSSNGSVISVSVDGANGDWWYLDMEAPEGQTLTPGTYPDATRYPFNDGGAGLSLDGNGRGCNQLTGSFTVTEAVFGPNGYVQEFDATFEQHCEGLTPAARGEVHISNPPPPAQLDLDLGVATDGTASTLNGNATVHGTVTCSKPTSVTVSGDVVQVFLRTLARGSYSTQVACEPGDPIAWTATAVPSGDVPFRRGKAEVRTQARGLDSDYGRYVQVDAVTVVTLRRA